MLSSVVKFGQILHFRFHPFWIFLLILFELCQEIELISIYNICFKNYSFRTLFWAKTGSAWATPKIKFSFLSGNNKRRSWPFPNFLFYQNIISLD